MRRKIVSRLVTHHLVTLIGLTAPKYQVRASSEHWGGVRGTLCMLQGIVNKTGVTLGGLKNHQFELGSMSPFTPSQNKPLECMTDGEGRMVAAFGLVTRDCPFSHEAAPAWTSSASTPRSDRVNADLTFETMAMVNNSEKWLSEILAENVLGMGDVSNRESPGSAQLLRSEQLTSACLPSRCRKQGRRGPAAG